MPVLSRLFLVLCLVSPLSHAITIADPLSPVPASEPAPAAEASAPAAAMPSKDEVLQAVAVLDKNFLGENTAVSALAVMQFAEQSKDIALQISSKTTPWMFGEAKPDNADEEAYRQMLLVSYIAGNVQAQLKAGKKADQPLAGWKFTLKSYQTIQKASPKIKIAELETLKAQNSKGQLEALAKKALQQ